MAKCELVSIQVGMPNRVSFGNHPSKPNEAWETGFIKSNVKGKTWVGKLNVAGDGQADKKHHGGPHKAVCVYCYQHYSCWKQILNIPEFGNGGFGENFTIDGVDESEVCIGDTWRSGDVTFQISQPRQPCWKLARRWNKKDLALQVQETGKTGWYFRVMQTGFIAAGNELMLVDRPNPQWTIANANHVMHKDKKNLGKALELSQLPELSPSWKNTLTKRATKNAEPDPRLRLGENV